MKRAYLRVQPEGLLELWHIEEIDGKLVTPNGHDLKRTEETIELRGWPDNRARVWEITTPPYDTKIGEVLIPE